MVRPAILFGCGALPPPIPKKSSQKIPSPFTVGTAVVTASDCGIFTSANTVPDTSMIPAMTIIRRNHLESGKSP